MINLEAYSICRVDHLDPIHPWRDVAGARLIEVSSTGRASCSRVNTRSGPLAVTRSRSVHAESEQCVPLAEVAIKARPDSSLALMDFGLTLHVQPACPQR